MSVIGSHRNSRLKMMSNNDDEAVSSTGEIMLFGVRVVVDPMRKSVSLNNLSQYQQPQPTAGYASADEASAHRHFSSATVPRDRKRGVPWTEEEHKLFLVGLQNVGKGDWRGISKNYVKTRTPTQVASHAQKYFNRRANLHTRRRRRSSLFDITTDTMTEMPIKDINQGKMSQGFHAVAIEKPMEHLSISHSCDQNAPIGGLDLNVAPTNSSDSQVLALGLSLSYDHTYSSQNSRISGYQTIPCFANADSFITVS